MKYYMPGAVYPWKALEINGVALKCFNKDIVGWVPVYKNKAKCQKQYTGIELVTFNITGKSSK